MIKLTSGHLSAGVDETSYQITWKHISLNATVILSVQIEGAYSETVGQGLAFTELEGMHVALADARAQFLSLSSTSTTVTKAITPPL
jgi:hypothetical protein